MKQEIVLPKFKIPGQTNWLVRGLWIGGGVVVLLTAVVVWGLVRQQEREREQLAEQKRMEARQAAEVAAAAAVKPKPPARPPAPRAAAPVSALAKAGPAGPGTMTKRYGAKAKSKGRPGLAARKKVSRSRILATKAGARGGARTAVKPRTAAKSAKGGDAIDDILRNFK